MITVTRLSGPHFLLNPDLIERVESTPDTVVTLLNGTKYVVAEPIAELAQKVLEYRASVASFADCMTQRPTRAAGTLRLLPTETEH